jgi:hypothetical protein
MQNRSAFERPDRPRPDGEAAAPERSRESRAADFGRPPNALQRQSPTAQGAESDRRPESVGESQARGMNARREWERRGMLQGGQGRHQGAAQETLARPERNVGARPPEQKQWNRPPQIREMPQPQTQREFPRAQLQRPPQAQRERARPQVQRSAPEVRRPEVRWSREAPAPVLRRDSSVAPAIMQRGGGHAQQWRGAQQGGKSFGGRGGDR